MTRPLTFAAAAAFFILVTACAERPATPMLQAVDSSAAASASVAETGTIPGAEQPSDSSVAAGLLAGAYPENETAGWLIGHPDDLYGFSQYRFGNVQYVTFDSVTGYVQSRPQWKSLVAFRVPDLAPGESLIGFYCRRNGESDHGLLAIVAIPEDPPLVPLLYTDIRRAWTINVMEHRFDEISTDGVDCFNEGAGV